MPGHRQDTGDEQSVHPPISLGLRRLGAVVGVIVVLLTVATVVVQYRSAEDARADSAFARDLAGWEDCRITAITRSTVTDDLIGAILSANRRIESSQSFDDAKSSRRDLDASLSTLQTKRQAALTDQANCGPRPVPAS